MNILEEIIQHKRSEVVARKQRGLATEKLADLAPCRGFRNALESSVGRPALIAEVKKASPSEGVIRDHFDPQAIARSYAASGATCLSVLTDERYFQGSDANLALCREAVDLPLLRKDFIVDEFQIIESRFLGADAILLIAAALTDDELHRFHRQAVEIGLDVLVEVHDEAEAERALDAGALMVGVNNRDLRTFVTDLGVSERLFPLLPQRLKVSESGIGTHDDIVRLRDAGADAVLIGTTFCREPNIEAKVREVMGR